MTSSLNNVDAFIEVENPRLLPPEQIAKIGSTVRLRWSEWPAGKTLKDCKTKSFKLF